MGRRIAKSVGALFRRCRRRETHYYSAIETNDFGDTPPRPTGESYALESPISASPTTNQPPSKSAKTKLKLPVRRIWTRNVCFMLLAHGLMAFHVGTFNNLWFIFLSTPRFDPSHPAPPSHRAQHLPFSFTGGLGMPPRSVGLAMAILGVIGITLQLFVYPAVNQSFGTLRSYRWSLLCFPFAYCLAPYLAVVPSSSLPPAQANGVLVWAALAGVLFVQVVARTFALPATIILLNNCSPHPSVLGTIHGIGQSVSSASRTIGPVLSGWLFGLGLKKGVVGGVWWGLAGVAATGWIASGWVYEGSGHEILLEGEDEREMDR